MRAPLGNVATRWYPSRCLTKLDGKHVWARFEGECTSLSLGRRDWDLTAQSPTRRPSSSLRANPG